jgi:hypothetical protein
MFDLLIDSFIYSFSFSSSIYNYNLGCGNSHKCDNTMYLLNNSCQITECDNIKRLHNKILIKTLQSGIYIIY